MSVRKSKISASLSRRQLLTGVGALSGLQLASNFPAPSFAAGNPIKIGLQAHRTGIGAAYGYWYERTSVAVKASFSSSAGLMA